MNMLSLLGKSHYRPFIKRSLLTLLFICSAAIHPGKVYSAEDPAALWQAVRSGHAVVLMRHAIAPGTGDPQSFTIGDCLTQRNLSETGRQQAEAIGNRFRANGIDKARVFSSQWCRCLETAERLDLGIVEELPELNSFFQKYEHGEYQTRELKKWITQQSHDQPLVLVTHQVNITAMTGIYPRSGEMVLVSTADSGAFSVLGIIETE